MTGTFLRDDIAAVWIETDPLEKAFALQGDVYRDVAGRKTMRVEIAGRYYFVKLHYGVGWREVLKNWLVFKRPVIGAENEYLVCRDLLGLGIAAPVPAAFAQSAGAIAARRSFVLCDELKGYTSLEDITDGWIDQPADSRTRQRLLYAVARFAQRFHEAGFVHRDFYICHLLAHDESLARGEVALAVLDLHRARRFTELPDRWRKRDMAALLFSSMDLGFSRRDWLRFLRIYRGQPLRQTFAEEGDFWQGVLVRAEKLYAEGQRKGIVKGLYRP